MKPAAYTIETIELLAGKSASKVLYIKTVGNKCHAHNHSTAPASHPSHSRLSVSGTTMGKLWLCGVAVAGIVLAAALANWQNRWLQSAFLLLSGLLIWTFLEYTIHRFLIHHRCRKHPVQCGRYPAREQRFKLVALFILVLAAAVALHPLIFIAAGMVGGWVWYCYIRVFAQWRGMSKFFPALYRQHLYHQAGGHDKGFGWTTILWDLIFHTHVPCGYVYSKKHGKEASEE
ncbi:MAG TPA: hypothetical protein VLC98_11065 [Phnomibacter sp.]|nr:hypothetical protein [Phnomibacter sp.]